MENDFVTLQQAQNKILKTLCKVIIKGKVRKESMLSHQNKLSVNQLNAQIKLTKMWKVANCEKYPHDITKLSICHHDMITEG